MSVRPEILMLIAACMVVTIVPRILPMILANRLDLPVWFLAWLRYIPVSVIAVLFFREVLITGGDFRQWSDPYLASGIMTLLFAFILRNIALTILSGIITFIVLRFLLGA